MKISRELIIITDKSFKRDILFKWGFFDILKKISKKVTCFDIATVSEQFFNKEIKQKKDQVLILYFINEQNGSITDLVTSLNRLNLPQYNIVFDCWAEKNFQFPELQSISFFELIKIIRKNNGYQFIDNNKAVLINPKGWQKESTNLGLASIAGSLKMFGFCATIFDINRYEIDDIDLKNEIQKINPAVIGYSAKTAVANEAGRLCKYLKTYFPETKMIVGGPHITLCANDFFKKNNQFDAGSVSEGEIHFPKISIYYCANLPINKLHNTVYRENGNVIENRSFAPENIDFPFWPDYDCIRNFSWHNFRYPIVTSRGCPYQCVYCCVNKLTGDRKWRYRDPDHVIAELEYFKTKYNINLFEIWDDNFTLNINRAKKICRLIIDKKLNLSWWCHNGIRADKIDSELANLMKSAGCSSIALGIETGNSKLFKSINKGESITDIIRAKKIIKQAGINVVGYFILGLPGDNLKTFIKTVRFQRKLKLDHFTYGILIPYPKTKVWDIIKQNGKMLIDVTQTQHFSDDIVPISFDLPSFPPQDITIAFYLTKYFELFNFANKYICKTEVVIQLDKSEPHFLFGLILSVPNKNNFTVKCYNTEYIFNEKQTFFLKNYFKPKLFLYNEPYNIKLKNKNFRSIYVISSKINSKGFLRWKPFFIFNSVNYLIPLKKIFKPKEAAVNYLKLSLQYLKNPVRYLKFPVKYLKFPVKYLKFPVKYLKFPVKYLKFPVKYLKISLHSITSFYRNPKIITDRINSKLRVLNFSIGTIVTKLMFLRLIKKIVKLSKKNNKEDYKNFDKIKSFIESENNENSSYL